MKLSVLALVSEKANPPVDSLLQSIGKEVQLTVVKVTNEQMPDLSGILKPLHPEQFDRTFLLLKNRYIYRQHRILQSLPGLVLRETDACQDRIPAAHMFRKFSEFYRKLRIFRLVCTGFSLAQHFRQKGIETHFVPKGADTIMLRDLGIERDIEIGFIGKMIHGIYTHRTRLLQMLHDKEGLQLFRTNGVDAYRNGLNRIKIFVSADIALGEYMYKNFEAMACGCLLLAFRQGFGEEEALGFEDMQNVVLYSNEKELKERLAWLRSNPDDVERIRIQGNRLIHSRWGFPQIGKQIADILEMPTVQPVVAETPWWRRLLSN